MSVDDWPTCDMSSTRSISPSPLRASLAREYIRLGVPADRMAVSENGCGAQVEPAARDCAGFLRIGYVGSIVWHKGIHVLPDAARGLRGPFRITIHGDTTSRPITPVIWRSRRQAFR
jgi:hypothetical protein